MTIVLVDQGSTGVGLTTGMQYQEIQVYKNTARADTGGEIGPGIQNLEFFLRWRAPGQDNDLVLSAQFDLVINALGTVIRYHDTGVVACL